MSKGECNQKMCFDVSLGLIHAAARVGSGAGIGRNAIRIRPNESSGIVTPSCLAMCIFDSSSL